MNPHPDLMSRSVPCRPTTDGIAPEIHRALPEISTCPAFIGKTRMFPSGRKKDEEIPVTQVLHLTYPLLIPFRPRSLRDTQAILPDHLLVEARRVCIGWDEAGDVEVVTVGDVTSRELLDKSSHRRRHTSVCHNPTSKHRYGRKRMGRCIMGATSRKPKSFNRLGVLRYDAFHAPRTRSPALNRWLVQATSHNLPLRLYS